MVSQLSSMNTNLTNSVISRDSDSKNFSEKSFQRYDTSERKLLLLSRRNTIKKQLEI